MKGSDFGTDLLGIVIKPYTFPLESLQDRPQIIGETRKKLSAIIVFPLGFFEDTAKLRFKCKL